jgi:hypothetical protein
MAAKAADGAFLDGNQHLMMSRQLPDQIMVERLGEAGVGNGGGEAGSIQIIGRLQAFGQPCAEGQKRHLRAFPHDSALADFEDLAALGHVHADTFAARVAERDRAFIIGRGCAHHVLELGLVGCSHHHEARQAGQIGGIEGPCMGGAVGADKPARSIGNLTGSFWIATSWTTWS